MFKACSSDEKYLTGMKIHAICADADIDMDKTRLLTYMHFKIEDNENDIHYFERNSYHDCVAIEVMLGNMAPLQELFTDDSIDSTIKYSFIEEHCTDIANNIKKLDCSFRKNAGMENRLSGELRNRLRMYRDETFRTEMINLYNEIILPRLALYDICTIKRAFKQAREREQNSELTNFSFE